MSELDYLDADFGVPASGEDGSVSANGNTPQATWQVMMRPLMDSRFAYQKVRIAWNNRIAAADSGRDKVPPEIYQEFLRQYDLARQAEESTNKLMLQIADMMNDTVPIYSHLISVKGVGPIMAVQLLAEIDIRRSDTPSALWRYAGYGVVDGRAERAKVGEKNHFNRRLRLICFNIGMQFLKSRSPYAWIYYKS